ncbi:hypothetical protein PLICRDRAFT_87528 [Plicaturopsis crispa FD-325 SS-3]|nr:hypothetical protein PLICRDRAFT_87528 [Plicaturopsis crispa FD-325 SS-3]
MARPPKSTNAKFSKPRPTGGKANAAGYAKRHSRQAKTAAGLSNDDVYEYRTQKIKRGRTHVALELGKDEAAEFGMGAGGADDEDEDGAGPLRARLIGENAEDEKIGSDEDDEIDSDDAFEESDEETYAGFSFSRKKGKNSAHKPKKSKAAVHFVDIDLNEDDDEEASDEDMEEDGDSEEEEEEGDSDEFIDILDVLDGKGEVDNGSDAEADDRKKRPKSKAERMEVDEDEDEDEEDSEESSIDEDEDDDHLSASDADEVAPAALQELEAYISGLDPAKKRKVEDTADDAAPRKAKRRIIAERTEAGEETEFGAQTSGSSKLRLDDLLAPLASQSAHLLSLKKSAKTLASSSGAQTLSAPLPQRTQERLDREAAYEQTKEEVDKWKDTMKRIKEAEHLSFPLQAEPASKVSNLELAAKFKPTTELESSIDRLLKSAKLRDEDIQGTEALKMNHLTVEEVAARRAELGKMRELMFRAEVKAKRVAKIKSKTYRRIKKKERAKLAAKLDEEGDEDDEETRMKREVERARERATLRHKNTGKWARGLKGKAELDGGERRDIAEMLQRGEQLRKKIQRRNASGDEDDESASDSDEDADAIRKGAFEELSALRTETPEAPAGGSKSIFEMNFMKEAMTREQRRADEVADDFLKEMAGAHGSESGAEDAQDVDGQTAVERTGGRVVYRPGPNSGVKLVRPPPSVSDASSVTLKSTDVVLNSPPPDFQPTSISKSGAARPPMSPPDASNPWLVPRSGAAVKAPRKANELVVGKNSTGVEKSKNKLKKQGQKKDEEREKAKEDAVVEIAMDNVMALNVPGPSRQRDVAADDDDDENSELEEQENTLDRKGKGKAKGIRAFEQRDLVARAFAGDNVVQSFQEAKRQEIEADAPREVDTTLPGWGSWGGAGTKKQAPRPHLIKKVAGVDPTTRADYNKAHVIISEKRDKKAAKYLVKDLPYPYTSKAQFERTMETPLGTEWNTRVGFQRGTLPKVVKKMGTIINPLEKMF